MEETHEWIRELVKAEELIEDSGFTSYELADPDRILIGASLSFLIQLRKGIQEAIQLFNDSRPNTKSKIKLYGIAKAPSDFMLFRNGIKLIFSLKKPGTISIRFHFMNPALPSVATMNITESAISNSISISQFQGEEALLEMHWGPFNEEVWTYQSQPFKMECLIKFYLTKFIQDSTPLDTYE